MSNYTILIVEDENIVALSIKTMLSRLHHKVLGPVSTGEAAVEQAVKQKPDLILMDIKLRGKLDGIEAAKIIKRTANIPIIYVTAFSDEQTLLRSITTEPFGYIVKPFDKKELKTAVEMAMFKSQSEKRLRQSEIKFRTLIERMNEGIVQIDNGTVILFVNERFCRMVGYTSQELEGKKFGTLLLFDRNNNLMAEKISLRKKMVSDRYALELKKKNGDKLWVEVSGSPTTNDDGMVTGSIDIFTDITLNKKGEEQILKLSRAVQQSPVSIIILDIRGNIEYINSKFSEVTGYSSAEIINSKPNLLLTQMLSLPEKRAIWDTITSGYEWKGEFQHKSKDNKIIWESASVSPIINEHGITTHYLAIFQDITKRKIQEEQLVIEKEKAEQSDRLKSEFLSQISHEVRTPLNNILTYISLLQEEFEEKLPSGMESAFSVINSSSKRLIRTIELILNLSRIQTGNFETKFEVLDLDKDLIDDLVLEFYSRAKFKNLAFNYENKARNTLVKGDQYSLGQIFVNLIDNAIKYTDRGEIRIEIIERNDKIDVNIIDTGIGIAEEFLPRIFEPFMQEDTGKHRNIEGTGLGLALVKKYIEINNIEINVKSEKGRGSTFTVSFIPVEKEKIT
jgi:PAS domain S-box-containing protein